MMSLRAPSRAVTVKSTPRAVRANAMQVCRGRFLFFFAFCFVLNLIWFVMRVFVPYFFVRPSR